MASSEHGAPVLTARRAGLIGCRHCGRVWPGAQSRCTRCGATLHSRYPDSLQRVWAWWVAGLLAFIPANLYPMLVTSTFGNQSASTIVGGVVELIHHHSYFVAGVVFFASIVIPVAKFFAIGYLAVQVRRARRGDLHKMHKLYEVVEFVGRWSMIDVFVVAILSALVHLGFVVDIFPGIAAVCFAVAVICTMLSALVFDPRLIYDELEEAVT